MKLTNFLKSGVTTVIVFLLALLILITMGFKLGFDFTGGSIITVNCQNFTQSQAENKIRDIIADYDNAKVYTIQYGEVYNEETITVKIQFTETAETTTEDIVADMFTGFNYDKTSSIEKNYIIATTDVGGAFTSSVFTKALISVLVVFVALAIYFAFRFGFTSAMAVIAGGVLDVLTVLSMMLIFRIEVSSFTGITILAMSVISAILTFLILSKLVKNSYDVDNKKLTNNQVVELTRKEESKTVLTVAGTLMFVVILLAIILPPTISGIFFALALGIAFAIITSLYIVPNLWSFTFARKTKQPKQKVRFEEVEEE